MAQTQTPTTGDKRGPGRPPKGAQPADKRRKLFVHTPIASSTHSPTGQSPAPERRTKLPFRVTDGRSLPTLSSPQPSSLSNDEYQTIAASGVLQAALDRSRLKWIHDGVLERYWTKPESGKNARPPPPNNPELKWQKHKGPCRIRVEPHIFEAEVYVEERSKPPQLPPVKQYASPLHPAFGQPYRPPQQAFGQNNQYFQNQRLPHVQQRQTPHAHPQAANTLPPLNGMSATPPRQQATPQPEKKASPDPVISMLATRASSDTELKALMKEVATGNATQEQLKIFQGHIDELTAIINEKKKTEEEVETPENAKGNATHQQSEMIQYDGHSDAASPAFQQQQPPPYPMYQQQPWPSPQPAPPAPTSLPVIIAFTIPGATEDRFLFPRNTILEALSPQHLLCSFIITRKPTPSSGLDPTAEYWQPVTMMIEVAYNREPLLEHFKRWVLPPDDVRKNMGEVMTKCTRAEDAFLPTRLPFKGSALAAEVEEPKDLTPDVEIKKRVKYVKKDGPAGAKGKKEGVPTPVAVGEQAAPASTADAEAVPIQTGEQNGDAATSATAMQLDGGADAVKVEGETPEVNESGRPKRAVRKSLRISEG